MPEMPEVEAHAKRLDRQFAGRVLTKFTPFNFTALKTAVPAPNAAYGLPLLTVGRRSKYLILRFEPISFVIHLVQGGRLLADTKLSTKPRGGQARFIFEPIGRDDGGIDETALLLTEQGKERRAGVWCVPSAGLEATLPVAKLGPEAAGINPADLAELFAAKSMRVHGFLRHQGMVAGIGRRLSNEICHVAQISPFATTKQLPADGAAKVAAAIDHCLTDGLTYEQTRQDMSSSKDRPGAVHNRAGEDCPVCSDTVRDVEYSSNTVNYCRPPARPAARRWPTTRPASF